MIPIEQLPAVSPLIYDYHYNFTKVAKFYNGHFRDFATMQAHIEQVRSRDNPREQLGSILKEHNRPVGGNAWPKWGQRLW